MKSTAKDRNLDETGKKAKKQNFYQRHPEIIFVIFALVFLVMGVYNLIRMMNPISLDEFWEEDSHTSGTAVEGVVHFGTSPCYTVRHTLNHIIETGNEYYYLIFNDDLTKCVCIRAEKGWDDALDHNGYSEDGIKIRGCLTELDYEAKKELWNGSISSYIEEGITVYGPFYIDGMQTRIAWLSIAAGVLLLVLTGVFSLAVNNKLNHFKAGQRKATGIIGLILFLIDAGLILHVLSFW